MTIQKNAIIFVANLNAKTPEEMYVRLISVKDAAKKYGIYHLTIRNHIEGCTKYSIEPYLRAYYVGNKHIMIAEEDVKAIAKKQKIKNK
jgi:hypothetical protein